MTALEDLRTRIDMTDAAIITSIAERFEICRTVGQVKRDADIPMMAAGRVDHVHNHYRTEGVRLGIPEDVATQLASLLVGAACELEVDIIDIRAGQERSPS